MKAWKIIVAIAVLAAIGAALWINRDSITRESIVAYGKSLPAPAFIAAFFVLPLLGFPLSILLVLAGIRFGFAWGMVLATVGTFFHHFVAYPLARGLFNDRIRRFAEHRGYKVPTPGKDSPVWFTILFTSIHGPPYALKLYLLALASIPFRIYCYVGAPVYILFCLIPVGAAAAAVHTDVTWVYIAIAVISVAAIAVKYWKSRKKLPQ